MDVGELPILKKVDARRIVASRTQSAMRKGFGRGAAAEVAADTGFDIISSEVTIGRYQ